jgi:hypothetical protein
VFGSHSGPHCDVTGIHSATDRRYANGMAAEAPNVGPQTPPLLDPAAHAAVDTCSRVDADEVPMLRPRCLKHLLGPFAILSLVGCVLCAGLFWWLFLAPIRRECTISLPDNLGTVRVFRTWSYPDDFDDPIIHDNAQLSSQGKIFDSGELSTRTGGTVDMQVYLYAPIESNRSYVVFKWNCGPEKAECSAALDLATGTTHSIIFCGGAIYLPEVAPGCLDPSVFCLPDNTFIPTEGDPELVKSSLTFKTSEMQLLGRVIGRKLQFLPFSIARGNF